LLILIVITIEKEIMQHHVMDKNDLRKFVIQTITDKKIRLEKFINFTLDASRDIKKTPKYDSIREEMQEEIYQMQRQLGALSDLQRNMAKVVNLPPGIAGTGSLVLTNKARFYISVSLGEFFYEGDRFYAISPESPMGQMMIGRQAGYDFVLNGIHQKIVEVL